MHDLENKRVKVSESVSQAGVNGPIVFTTTGDKFVITPGNPIGILRWGVIFTVAKDASALVITLARRPTAGSDTARAVVDTMTDSATARAAGIILERKIAGTNPNASTGIDNSLVSVAPLVSLQGGGVVILPGQEAVFAVTTASASTGQGFMYAEYIEYPGVVQNTSNLGPGVNYTVVQL